MYGIFTYIWVIIRANVGKYTIHGAYGYIYIYVKMIEGFMGDFPASHEADDKTFFVIKP